MALSSDTSRSPIPIDPETYKNMHSILPQKMDGSSNDLAMKSQDAVYHERSHSISSNERKNAAESKVSQ